MLIPAYMGLWKPIVDELKLQGYDVHIVFDACSLENDYNFPWLGIRDRLIRQFKSVLTGGVYRGLWTKKLKSDPDIEQYYDVFFCVNGCCLDGMLFKMIEKKNPHIRKILYLWDNSAFYGYYKYAHRFDRVITYDLEDSKQFHVEFLPFYWVPQEGNSNSYKYTISMVGTNHSNRLNIVKSVDSQIQNMGGGYFKILDKALPEDRFITHKEVSQKELLTIMSQSNCILDTDRASQTGTTPRLIWALAMGKKIITTNTNIVKMPFYSKEQFLIIDRDNPVLDIDFVLKPFKGEIHPYVDSLRIDRWVKKMLK